LKDRIKRGGGHRHSTAILIYAMQVFYPLEALPEGGQALGGET